MKHLNPRQGITTPIFFYPEKPPRRFFECETPKSPPGDYNLVALDVVDKFDNCSVKHLNPRQGITTTPAFSNTYCQPLGVKHLNPRQGITTGKVQSERRVRHSECETPKSPPGDYNLELGEIGS